jgi:hypothetical protein
LATVAIASVWEQVEAIRPPRALYVDFPLGRPLGRPNDPTFQRGVLDAAFGLLDRPAGPVLERYGRSVTAGDQELASCPVPPRSGGTEPPAVDEARALAPAYRRAVSASGGRTLVGRVVGPEAIPDAVAALVRIAEGQPWEETGLPATPPDVVLDVRAYYEEAALALAGHVPAARAAEHWFYQGTETGKVLLAAQAAMRARDDAPLGMWFYMAPMAESP